MTNDPQNLGLGELGQRVQAMSDPVAAPNLRPYQGSQQSANPTSNGRQIPRIPLYEDLLNLNGTDRQAVGSQIPDSRIGRSTPPPPPAQYSAYSVPSPSAFQSAVPYTPVNPPAPPAAQPGAPNPFSAASQPPGQAPASLNGAPPQATPNSFSSLLNAVANTSNPSNDPNAPTTGLQRAINAIRSTLPLVQRLFEGNLPTAVNALVPSQPVHHPAPPPPQVPQIQQIQVDLEPIERGLAEVRTSHRELRGQVLEQVTSLKRVEDQLERVREATDRNTLEQQELVEDMRSVGNRVGTFAMIGVILLAISLGLNIYFLVQLQHILR